MAMNGVVPGSRAGAAVAPFKMDKAADFANYFCTYAYLYHQKEMLSDRVRMDAYYHAIFRNARHFAGKAVLDVGTGSGILAIWSAQAGARKVYAVEATNMAQQARKLVEANQVGHIVEVIEGSIEDISLPEKVDVIISEWMGYYLIRESMFDSVIHARDRWLKPSGVMYPSNARMWLAPIASHVGEQKNQEFQNAMVDWDYFNQEMNDEYGVDMSVLTTPFLEEQRKYYLQTSLWVSLYPNQVIGAPALVKEIDCHLATIEDISSVKSIFKIPFTKGQTKFCGLAGWFDVHFKGSPIDPADHDVELTTAPMYDQATHWGQQVFVIHPSFDIQDGDVLQGSMEIVRSKQNHRLMDVTITHEVQKSEGSASPPVTSFFYIE
ncbi:hypothetical protein O6H91_10G013300 [Diphasiastrum complanatum]|uniref:Uncharacterized protein n=1 Tax=Diphasiastrum complanatum TaxID=34168 RepID=A0ACC2CEC4_DIPCM|nr:hypothetical protein O6H91_Y121000 [Diphasiastrum complanatum]KAJ7540404.1 hypothetical protein O6H91_10G013300 [Diphasiastrum complanatum]